MDSSLKISIPSQVLARGVGDETVILDLASGAYFGLDAVGARMWQLMNEEKSVAQVCTAIEAEYEVTRDQVERDLAKLLEDLASHGLVTLG